MHDETDDTVRVAAPAKLNLYLHVTGRRDNGYHELDSLVAFAHISDVITARAASGLELEMDGPFAQDLPDNGTNLVLAAAKALRTHTGITSGAALTLTKNLPVASGIGGGSADAAAVIKALARLWGLHPGHFDLSGLALDLGADVPVCLFGRPAFMGGIGEDIEAAPALPETALVLVNPGVAVSTPEVFKARDGAFTAPARFEASPPGAAALAAVLIQRGNDLAPPAIALAPVIDQALTALAATPACLMARMSGSGATCFGLFANDDQAADAARGLEQAHPDWWVQASRLI